jgi:hypothetical protein
LFSGAKIYNSSPPLLLLSVIFRCTLSTLLYLLLQELGSTLLTASPSTPGALLQPMQVLMLEEVDEEKREQ